VLAVVENRLGGRVLQKRFYLGICLADFGSLAGNAQQYLLRSGVGLIQCDGSRSLIRQRIVHMHVAIP
jgi:hypothetical protein